MLAVFLRILNNAVLSSFVIGAVVLMRVLLRRSPKWLTAAMWGLVAIRLILPFSLSSPTSLIPSAKPLEAIGISEEADDSAVPAANRGESAAPSGASDANDPAAQISVSDENGHDASAEVRHAASAPAVSPVSGLTPAEPAANDPAYSYSDKTDAARTADADSAPITDPVKSEPTAAPAEATVPASEAAASADNAAILAPEAIPARDAAADAGEAKAAPDVAGPDTKTAPEAAHATGTVAMWIWLGAAIALIGFEIGSYLVTRLRLRTATRVEGGVFQSERVPGPFVLGFVRPRIYMPYKMSAGTAKYALAHERAHIKRRDNIAKPLAFILVAVYWFDPLVWLAYVLFCRDIELACDEKVIRAYDEKERRAYASALLEIGSGRNLMNTVICPLAFGNISIKERIKKVVNYKKVSAVAVALAIVLGALTAAFFLTDPISADKDGNIKLADTASEEIASEPETAAPDADTAPADAAETPAESERGAGPILAPGVKLDADTTAAETEPVETEPAETEATNTEPAETKAPAETKPTQTKPAQTEPAQMEPAEMKTQTDISVIDGETSNLKAITKTWFDKDEGCAVTAVMNQVEIVFLNGAYDPYYKFSAKDFPEIPGCLVYSLYGELEEGKDYPMINLSNFCHQVTITLPESDDDAVERAMFVLSSRIGKDIDFMAQSVVYHVDNNAPTESGTYPFSDGHSGDANADGVVDVEDMKAVAAVCKSGRRNVEDGAKGDMLDPYAADVDGNGKINSRDFLKLGRALGYTDDEIIAIGDTVEPIE